MSEIRVENIIGETGVDAVKFTKGVNVTGIVTATSFVGSGAGLTNVSGGKLLSVVQSHSSTRSEVSDDSNFTATVHQVSITPTAASSKILINFNGDCNTNSADRDIFLTIYRSVNGGTFTDIAPAGSGGAGNGFTRANGSSSARIEVPFCINYLDSPTYSVGNAIIYKLYVRRGGSSGNVEVPSSNNRQAIICIAQEISA